jgi:hypothetical protein
MARTDPFRIDRTDDASLVNPPDSEDRMTVR